MAMNGRVPNSASLQLHQVIINTIPNFDGRGDCEPGVEVILNGRLIYSSISRLAELAEISGELSDQSQAESEMMGEEEEDDSVMGKVKRIFSRRDSSKSDSLSPPSVPLP